MFPLAYFLVSQRFSNLLVPLLNRFSQALLTPGEHSERVAKGSILQLARTGGLLLGSYDHFWFDQENVHQAYPVIRLQDRVA